MDKPKRAKPKAEKLLSMAQSQSLSRGLSAAAAELITKALAPAASHLGSLLGDQMAHFRARNLNRLADYWRDEVQRREVNPDALAALPFAKAHRLFDDASMEDDDDVLKLWAALLAGAMTPGIDIQAHKMLCGILKDLEGPDAILLELLWSSYRYRQKNNSEVNYNVDISIAASWENLNNFARKTAVLNVIRLGCAALPSDSLSNYGLDFVRGIQLSPMSNFPNPPPDPLVRALDLVERGISSAINLSKGVHTPVTFHSRGSTTDFRCAQDILTLTLLGRTLMETCRAPS
ncbi:Abi-alpha family protein [Paramagnetospirillum magnetotacticum]|uniref:Abi-alpha family protein n=1 Tax=Paramagnetospirillum magnetotacticum TaxID=188 RepID=UPI001269FEC2|nr:hypothetical protein [Paramagnetospirillum magnetotacticum]